MRTSAILLDVESGEGRRRGPAASGPPRRGAAPPAHPRHRRRPLRASLERYTRSHIRAVGADGRDWRVGVVGGHVERIDGADAPRDVAGPDAAERTRRRTSACATTSIVEQLVTHKAIATVRTQWDKGRCARPETLGVFDWNTSALGVDGDGGSWLRSVDRHGRASGQAHRRGRRPPPVPPHAAHPGAARRASRSLAPPRRRTPQRRPRRARRDGVRGRPLVTLAPATFGVVDLPTRLVQSLIALSILSRDDRTGFGSLTSPSRA